MPLTRQHKVLQAIIEDYVSRREPVGSKALVDLHQLGVSSATVRNDMVALEELGLIQAPHSSAGRVPTIKGYRFFVDEIANPRPLTNAERNAIHHFLDHSDNVEQIYEQTVRLLSQLTQQVAILQLPHSESPRVQHVELLKVSESQVMVLLITHNGNVQQRLLHLSEASLDLYAIQQKILGVTKSQEFLKAQQITLSLAETAVHPTERKIFETLAELLATEGSSKLLIAGTSYLAQSTNDFQSSIAPILEALEEQVTMLQLLSSMASSQEVVVKIGADQPQSALDETSIITSSYGHQSSAKLGILGPTRMDYASSMTAVRGVAEYLSKILGK